MRRHWLTTVVLLGALVLLGFWTSRLNDARTQQGEQAHNALCIFKADLKRRVKDGKDFLDKHPEGIPGFSPALIRNSLANQQKTVDALSASGLDCP